MTGRRSGALGDKRSPCSSVQQGWDGSLDLKSPASA